MKLNENFVLRQVADNWVVLPLATATVDFNRMLTLNESGVMLWRILEGGCTREEMTEALLKEYEVERDVALADVDAFIAKLTDAGCID